MQGEEYNVTTTNFAPKSGDQIAAIDPDLIILDLVAGQRAGRELLARVREEV